MLHGHEDGVEDDTDSDAEVNERIHDDGKETLFEPTPAATTVPLQEDVGKGIPTWRTWPLIILKVCKRKSSHVLKVGGEQSHPSSFPVGKMCVCVYLPWWCVLAQGFSFLQMDSSALYNPGSQRVPLCRRPAVQQREEMLDCVMKDLMLCQLSAPTSSSLFLRASRI